MWGRQPETILLVGAIILHLLRRLAPFLALPSRRNEVGTFPDASIDGTLPLDYDSRTKCMTLTYPAGKIARSGMTARLRLCKPETATEAVWSAWTDALVRLSRARARARLAPAYDDMVELQRASPAPRPFAASLRHPPRRDQGSQRQPLSLGELTGLRLCHGG